MNPLRTVKPLLERAAAVLPVRRLALVVAVAFAGLGMTHGLLAEPPLGQVRGQVLLDDAPTGTAAATVSLVPADPNSPNLIRRTAAGADGRFAFARVMVGGYSVVAETAGYESRHVGVTVIEAATTPVTLSLWRSRPSLELAQHRHVFLPDEGLRFPVHGYVDGRAPSGKDALRVRVFRASVMATVEAADGLRALFDVLYGRRDRADPAALLRLPAGHAPVLVLDRPVALTNADGDGFFSHDVTVDAPGPGFYLVEITHGDQRLNTWAVVTRVALVVKRAPHQVVAFAVDAQSGRALPGAAVRVYFDGRLAATGTTNAGGVAEMVVAKEPPSWTPLVAVAGYGGDAAVLARYEWSPGEGNKYAVHLYTDRPIYRPGQRIYYKGITRAVLARPAAYRVVSNEPVDVELRDPNGDQVTRTALRTSAAGSFNSLADLSPEAPTGTYSIIATIRGERHFQSITVAAYRKPEFAVTVTPAKPHAVRGEPIQFTISGQYYFGGPLAGAAVRYTTYLTPDWAAIFGWSDEDEAESDTRPPLGFRGAYGYSYGQVAVSGEARLDGQGKAVITIHPGDLPVKDPGYEYVLTTSVLVRDASGREAAGDGRTRLSQGDFLLRARPRGWLTAPRQPAVIDVTAEDFLHRPVAGAKVEVETGYDRWSYGSGTSYTTAGTREAVLGPDGRAKVVVVPSRTGEFVVTVRARDRGGHLIGARAWVWVADDIGGDLPVQYAGLSLLTDKRSYAPGETARVLLNTEFAGLTAYLTIEGDRIFRTIAVPVTRHSTVVNVPMLPEYGPNVYLAGTYVHDRKLAASEIPLRVSIAARLLTIAVQADRTTYQPGERITYRIRTTDVRGRPTPAEVSLGVVDESIYALQEDDLIGPRGTFYPRRYNAVQTFNSLAVEYLGDTDKAGPHITTRKRFPDTAYWAAAIQTDADGRATLAFELPDSLTRWRATAIGHTAETVVGRGVSSVTVTKPFLVRLETPRFLTQGDRSRILALVHNNTPAPVSGFARLEAQGLGVAGTATRRITIRPGQMAQVEWAVTAPRAGPLTVRLTAWTRGGTGQRVLTDGVELPLTVRLHGQDDLVSVAGDIQGSRSAAAALTRNPRAVPSGSGLTIRVTPSVAAALGGAVDYLVGFPYGCTEQTLSRFYPDLLVQSLTRSGAVRLQDQQLAAQLPAMVRDGLQRLYRFQHPSGAWGWWEHDPDDPWMTAYVLIGLATAQHQGYAVSPAVLRRGIEGARSLLDRTDPDTKPLLLFALTEVGDVKTARETLPTLSLDELPPEGLAYAVLLEHRLGVDTRTTLRRLKREGVHESGRLSWFPSDQRHSRHWSWNGTDRTATAVALRAMLAAAPHDPDIAAATRWLMAHRTGSYWWSTRDTADVLAALVDYVRVHPEDARVTGQVRVRVGSRIVQAVDLAGAASGGETIVRVPAAALTAGANQITLERTGGASTVFYSAQLHQTVAVRRLAARGVDRVEIFREYLRVVPRKTGGDYGWWRTETEPTGNVLHPNDWIRVRLTLRVKEDLTYVLIEDPYPAGVEVMERGSPDEVADWWYWWSSVDVRDDRIAFFARTLPAGEHVIEYNLRVRTPGVYRAMPTVVAGMYDDRGGASGDETEVTVR